MLQKSKLGKELAFEKKETMKEKDRIVLSIRTLAPLLFLLLLLLLPPPPLVLQNATSVDYLDSCPGITPPNPASEAPGTCLPTIDRPCMPFAQVPLPIFFWVWCFLRNGLGEGRN
jgi:hypothetical protein